jgi:hypothetical protein
VRPLIDRPILQRACDCERCAKGSCSSSEHELQRHGLGGTSPAARGPVHAPPIVHEVLRSAGHSLDAQTSARMGARFDFDFSGVKVHDDSRAAESARQVHASAYTVGSHVVFGAARYAPATGAGDALLAHELTHVMQQSGAAGGVPAQLPIGPPDSAAERAADAAEAGRRAPTAGGTAHGASVQRQPKPDAASDTIDVDLVLVPPDEAAELKKRGIDLPKVGPKTARILSGLERGGESLTDAEKARIAGLLKLPVPASSPLASPQGAQFLLHDTAGILGPDTLQREVDLGRGPLGKGVSAYVPRAGDPVVARPNFFEAKRSTTTEFEKGSDILNFAGRAAGIKQVWESTKSAERDAAFARALAGTGLTAEEIAAEKGHAEAQIKAGLKAGGAHKDKGATSAAWTVEEICGRLSSGVAAATLAEPGRDKDLTAACTTLGPVLAAREQRVASTVTVEINQETGLKNPAAADQNTCNPKSKNVKPLPNPAYEDSQYQGIMMLYLRAALTAGAFPKITTHFAVDAFTQGHCDPRCFDLDRLYGMIAAAMGHQKGTHYGIDPSYGLAWGKNAIWWDNTICGKGPPAP